jgi:hypothetical protein
VDPGTAAALNIDTQKSRVHDAETAREKELRGRLEKAEREIEVLKKRLPPEPVPLEPKK